jgi:hypothetical protein
MSIIPNYFFGYNMNVSLNYIFEILYKKDVKSTTATRNTNPESQTTLKERVMNYILRKIC